MTDTVTPAPLRPAPLEDAPTGRPFLGRLRLPFSPWHLVLIPVTFILIVPLLWMLITSLETEGEANRFPPVLLPESPQFGNYSKAWAEAPFGHFFVNSAVVTLVVLVSNLVVCGLAGYAFARIRFLGRGALFVTLMATLMVPFQVTMIPVFLIVKWFGDNVWEGLGIDHIGALMLPNLATAFGIFFLRQFFLSLPKDLEEAARVDGAGEFRIYRQIVLPLAGPALLTLALFHFMYNWNDLLWPLLINQDASRQTLPSGLAQFMGQHVVEYGLLMAASVLALLPVIIFFLLIQRRFVEGVATTGIK
jgi:multiple sugar transport system permease protein